LNEEKAADEKLTSVAEAGINQDAANTAHPAETDEEDELVSAGRRPGRVKGSARPGRR
jgi:hypothetical protein